MDIVNCTPHAINLNNGTVYPPSGTVTRVAVKLVDSGQRIGGAVVFGQNYGQIIDLPTEKEGTIYIVSAMVLEAAKADGRLDCFAPATGHPDVIRNDKGYILSVPGFVC